MDGKRNTSYDKREGAAFEFVNIDRPGYATDQRVRRQVKSHVSRLQHRQERERQFKNASRSRTLAASYEAGASSSHDSSEDGQATAVTPAEATAKSWIQSTANSPLAINLPVSPSIIACPIGTLERSFSRGSMAFRTIALNDPQNIIGRNVARLRLDLSSIMSFYRMISIIQSQDFDHQYGAIIPGVTSWKRFYAFVFTDPIMLTTAILLTTRHQFEVLGRDYSGKDGVYIANMERFLLNSINEALQDPVRGISDQMLIAVALYAAYEIKHGNGERYHIHMRGLVQMIKLRGGLCEIGLQDPYMERLLLWQDANTSKLADVEGYLQASDNSLGTPSSQPRPNLKLFQLR